MRFFEIAGQPNRVVSTAQFDKDFVEFLRIDPELKKTLAAFLRFREHALPQQGFNKKDYPYTGGSPLAGYRHVHLVFGQIILTYQLAQGLIKLCAITDHDAIDNTQRFANYLNGIPDSAYHDFTGLDVEEAKLNPEQAQAVVDTLYDLASQPEDRQMLVLIAKGREPEGFFEYVCAVIDLEDTPETRKMIFGAFKGMAGFQAKVAEVLKQTQ